MARATTTTVHPTNDAAFETLVALRDELRAASEAAVTLQDIRRINRALEVVTDELMDLRVKVVEAAAAQYSPAASRARIKILLEDLDEINKNIKEIAVKIDTIASILDAIAKAAKMLIAFV